jgi:hypothetical protein
MNLIIMSESGGPCELTQIQADNFRVPQDGKATRHPEGVHFAPNFALAPNPFLCIFQLKLEVA